MNTRTVLYVLVAVSTLAAGMGWGAYFHILDGRETAVERARIEAYERGLLNGAKATAAREAKRAREQNAGLYEQCMAHNRALRFTVNWMENREELGW